MTGRHLQKRSFTLAGHRTSVALEPAFWAVLEQLAARQGTTLSGVVQGVDAGREEPDLPLASALRVHALAAQETLHAAKPVSEAAE
ncbi:ribbon-helix-helix domain-containing protein [Pseudoroseomonas globiformis]|uniref:Ribbon-helix-helix domain-containing protein n=1 Tax=Teichococcus globiformis TaxID=2307229 RepID=A0ABV7G115_9PROT